MKFFKSIYDNSNKSSIATNARIKRFKFFIEEIKDLKRPLKILDIGGTQKYWEMMGFINQSDITIYLLNLDSQKTNGSNFVSLIGDATDLSQFSDNSFDLVFSNSVIEHLFTWENQVKMANEVMRVGNNHFIQTPNFWFPIEPHFVFPFFQFLPKPAKILLMLRFRLGNFDKFQNKTKAEEKVHEIQLLRVC